MKIPKLSLVVLIGSSGSGKSTFARRHFLPTEIVSSDTCRGWVSDDPNDQSATMSAFAVVHTLVEERLKLGRLTVVDATNVRPEDRKRYLELARAYHVTPVAMVFDLPEAVCRDRNAQRPDRHFGAHVVRRQQAELRRSVRALPKEGFRRVFTFDTVAEVDAAHIEREPLRVDLSHEMGPFDIIGDVHGCITELETLLTQLGYVPTTLPIVDPIWGERTFTSPTGRKAVFVGDLVDRGPGVVEVVRLVHNMIAGGAALCVAGNHDVKFAKKFLADDAGKTPYGLKASIEQYANYPPEVGRAAAAFLDALPYHLVLDGGRLVVAHAGLKQSMHGRTSSAIRAFALFGDTNGEIDAHGIPVRLHWENDYRGRAMVVYGHTCVTRPEWVNHTANIDTGCVYGGGLTALQYPERTFLTVPALKQYWESVKPFLTPATPADDGLLDAEDVMGKRILSTRLRNTIIVRPEQATAALEVMSRYAVDPRWLIYLPPTMSPCETSRLPGYLEHPAEAFAYFRNQGVEQVVCQEKHMGSRAVVIVCKDAQTARERFGTIGDGCIYTRTGRAFFNDPATEQECLDRLRSAFTASGLWDTLGTSWACLDCELMPWSAKAQELLKSQYAVVGSAGRAALPGVMEALGRAEQRLTGEAQNQAMTLATAFGQKCENVAHFITAYRGYCWPVAGVTDLKLAPFHLLATEGRCYFDRSHAWHMETLASLCAADPLFLRATAWKSVELADAEAEAEAIAWWTTRTDAGAEGMVVKPSAFIVSGPKGLVQPAVKCRGREYLRIIYGPDYDLPTHLDRLRKRGLGSKRGLASGEFALGVEALERFVAREPLRRVHECVFGVLALESEPVDPRL